MLPNRIVAKYLLLILVAMLYLMFRGINGVQFTDSEATGSISLVANSPLTINAPVNAGNGTLQLTPLLEAK